MAKLRGEQPGAEASVRKALADEPRTAHDASGERLGRCVRDAARVGPVR
jgi:hypothetical protein